VKILEATRKRLPYTTINKNKITGYTQRYTYYREAGKTGKPRKKHDELRIEKELISRLGERGKKT